MFGNIRCTAASYFVCFQYIKKRLHVIIAKTCGVCGSDQLGSYSNIEHRVHQGKAQSFGGVYYDYFARTKWGAEGGSEINNGRRSQVAIKPLK